MLTGNHVKIYLTSIKIGRGKAGLFTGAPYDPLAKEDPDVTLAAEERPIGGLGIFMVKKSMDDVRYEYREGKNVLTIRKRFG